MAEITQQTPTNNQLFTQYDISKIFLFENRYRKVNIASTPELALTAGMIIGVVGVTHGVYKSGTSNMLPVGILAESVTIPAASNLTVTICNAGKIAEEKVTLDGTDTLATIVSNRSIRDMLISNTMGIELVTTNELTADDNI
jgi:hypothetical protein